MKRIGKNKRRAMVVAAKRHRLLWLWPVIAIAVISSAHAANLPPCVEAIRAAEAGAKLPPALLGAIALVESGRIDPATRRIVPWPWTINVEGTGFFFETRDDAVAAVKAAQLAGRRSVDVGCMQINLQHHPAAFPTLEDAFDPRTNAIYAASFLKQLYAQTQDWGNAAAAYHSQTPGMSDDYRRRVVAGWSGAALYGVSQWPSVVSEHTRPEPYGGYTPEFRARLRKDAAEAKAVRIAMGLLPDTRGAKPAVGLRSRPMLQASLRN